jgi:hypothetical protein
VDNMDMGRGCRALSCLENSEILLRRRRGWTKLGLTLQPWRSMKGTVRDWRLKRERKKELWRRRSKWVRVRGGGGVGVN